MKQQLLKQLFFVFALFGALTISAQSFTFDTDLEGFTQNFGTNGTVEWADDGGVGALKLTRITNNANFGKGSNGNTDPAVVGIDADATPVIKIVIKNLTAGLNVRVGSKGGDGTAGNKNFNGILTANSGSYQTFILDMTGQPEWNGNLTNFWIAVRGNIGTDADAAYIDSIELLASIPQTISEFILNSSFEDATGITHLSGPQTQATRALTTDQAHDGTQSLSTTFIANATPGTPVWNFSNFEVDYASGEITSSTTANVTMWVKSTRSTPARIITRLRTANQADDVLNLPSFPTATAVTSGVADTWEQLSFEIPIGTFTNTGGSYDAAGGLEVRSLRFWFGVDSDDPDAGLNGVNGDIFYFDEMVASFGVLGVEDNTFETISMYPNPASGYVNIKSLEGVNIEVYNVIGKLVKSETSQSSEHEMNISDLTSGIYLVKLTSEGKTATKKLIIKLFLSFV